MLSKMPSNKAQKSDEQILEAQGQHDEPLRLDMLMPVKQETSYEDISADRLEESKMREKAIIDRLKFENDTDGYELDAARRRISSDISPISCGPVKEEICYEGIIKEEHGDSEMQDKSIIDKLKFENDTEEYQIDAARRRISSDASPTSCGPVKQETCYEAKSEAHHGDSDANKENLRRGPPKRGRNAGRAGPLLSIPSGSRDGNSAANVQSSRGKRGGGKTRSSRKRGVQAGQARGRAGGAQKRPLAQNEENLEESPLGSSLDAPPFAKRRKSLDQDQNFKLPKPMKQETSYEGISADRLEESKPMKQETSYEDISADRLEESNRENLEELLLGSSLDAPPFAKRRKSLDQDQNFKLPKPMKHETIYEDISADQLEESNRENLEKLPLGSSLDAPPFAKRRKSLDQDLDIKHPKYNQPSTSADHSYARPTSSAYIGCEMSTPSTEARLSQTSSHPVIDDGIFNLINYGSEEESEDSYEENEDLEVCGSRVERAMAEVVEDTPEEAQAAGRVKTPCVEAAEPEDHGVMHGPTTLFDFEWQSYPSEPIDPRLRREQFVGKAGPMIGPISNVYDAFVLIWDRPIMEHIAAQTNTYAQEYAEKLVERGLIWPSCWKALWRDTDVDELYVYFSLILTMGIVVKTRLEDYWTNDGSAYCTPYFAAHMPLKRFKILSKCLHFNSNSAISLNNPTPLQAKIHKVMPIVDHLNAKFPTLYGLGRSIALDDSLTRWKSGPDIPNKAEAIRIKTYEVCDCRTGYLWRFECHAGAGSGQTEVQQGVISGSIPNVVLRLLRGLEHRGHTVWMDDYYNSPALARVLKSMGYDCVGTLRTNRQFVPRQLTDLKKSDMRIDEVCGYTSGDVDLLVWRCPNRVALLSTYHGAIAFKDKLIAILDYNTCMGGVDIRDQTLSSFPIDWKQTRSWYKNIFWRLLNVSVLNAFILYEHTHDVTHKKFRMDLVKQLLDKHQKSTPAPTAGSSFKFTQDYVAHFPRELPDCSGSEKAGKLSRVCVVCKTKRTNYVCATCNVSLCIDFAELVTSCYMKYHT